MGIRDKPKDILKVCVMPWCKNRGIHYWNAKWCSNCGFPMKKV